MYKDVKGFTKYKPINKGDINRLQTSLVDVPIVSKTRMPQVNIDKCGD